MTTAIPVRHWDKGSVPVNEIPPILDESIVLSIYQRYEK
jgi:hypothetical protein